MLVPLNKDEYLFPKGEGPRRLTILGSTGSIGTQTLSLVRENPDLFSVFSLTAHSNTELLAQQIIEFHPLHAVITDDTKLNSLRTALAGHSIRTKIHAGQDALCDLVSMNETEFVVAAIVGFAGVPSLLRSVELGKPVALANKESLVACGELVTRAATASKNFLPILPVDSEHSAIFQALLGQTTKDIKGLVLTASGGPFLRTPLAELRNVRPEEAKKHPNWSMGAKVSIDSATMFNKALELIEAHWLFSIGPEFIEVVVHPQSIVHSAVTFADGSQIAQLSYPDMRGPISFAINFPRGRVKDAVKSPDLAAFKALEFMPLDNSRFPAVEMARAALRQGGLAPALFNAANEVAVAEFLSGRVRFDQIPMVVSRSLEKFPVGPYYELEQLIEFDKEVRRRIKEEIGCFI